MLKPQDSCSSGAGIGMTGCNTHSHYYIDRNREHSCMVKHKRRHHHKRKHEPNSSSSSGSSSHDSESDFEETPPLPQWSNPDGTAYVFFGLCAVVAIVLITTLAS
jgi:hypothetical protein